MIRGDRPAPTELTKIEEEVALLLGAWEREEIDETATEFARRIVARIREVDREAESRA